MKIFVFGSSGMLGTYVHKYFHHSVGVTRDQVNALLMRRELFDKQLDKLFIKSGDVVINCIGITNKHTPNVDEFLVVNSLFPRLVSDYCASKGVKMIHISTDCVFSGAEGMYCETDPHDDENIYGISKSIGEPTNCCVIRTSIIGENRRNSLDLLEWVRSHKDTTINGWKNHFWNGVTTVHLAEVIEKILDQNLYIEGIYHIHSPNSVSKRELLELLDEVYELHLSVKPPEAPQFCDRTLSSKYSYSKLLCNKTIKMQIYEMKDFFEFTQTPVRIQ